jgi:hypothetical protein
MPTLVLQEKNVPRITRNIVVCKFSPCCLFVPDFTINFNMNIYQKKLFKHDRLSLLFLTYIKVSVEVLLLVTDQRKSL